MADDTDVATLEEHLRYFWPKDLSPDIVLSFLGGGGKKNILKDAEDTLREGLSKVLYMLTYFFGLCVIMKKSLYLQRKRKGFKLG